MDALTTAGTVRGTSLSLGVEGAEKAVLSVTGPNTSGYNSLPLSPDWLLPLAAWFAGEAQPASLGDRPGTLYGRRLEVRGDEYAVVWGTHTWARLDCALPFGTARVTVGPRDKGYGWTVMLPPEGRAGVARWLRRADAGHWTEKVA